MKRLLIGCLALGIVTAASSSNVQAGLLPSVLSGDGAIDVMDDDSVSFVVDNDGDSALSVGDFIVGVLRIGSTTSAGVLSATDQLAALFSFEITSSTGVAGADPTVTLTHSGIDPAGLTGFSIDELLATAGVAVPGAFGAGAMIAILSDTGNPTDPTDLTFGAALGAFGASYMLDAVLGLSAAADYLEIAAFRDFNDSGELDFAEIPAPGPSGTFLGSEAGGFSVLYHTLGGGTVFLPVSSTHTDGSTVTVHDVAVSGTVFGTRSDTPAGYLITDSTAIVLNPVPEPSTITLFSIALAGLGFAGLKRRRQQKNAA